MLQSLQERQGGLACAREYIPFEIRPLQLLFSGSKCPIQRRSTDQTVLRLAQANMLIAIKMEFDDMGLGWTFLSTILKGWPLSLSAGNGPPAQRRIRFSLHT